MTTRRWTPLQIILFVLALPAVVTPFVSFTWRTSPLEVVSDTPSLTGSNWPLFGVGLSFFAAFPILLWKSRRLLWATPPARWERRVLAVVAVVVTVPAFAVIATMLWELPQAVREGNFRSDGIGTFGVALVTFAGGLILAAMRWRRRNLLAGLETLLLVGFLANAAMCLFAFHDDPEFGYWLTVPVAASFAAEMLLPARQNL